MEGRAGVVLCFLLAAVSCFNCQNETVVDIFWQPFSSLDDAYDRMKCARDVMFVNGDRRAIFLTLYVETTFQVRKAIRETDLFQDKGNEYNMVNCKAWMEYYTYHFADLYRKAVVDWDSGNSGNVPDCWKSSFEHSTEDDILIGQHLVLGINAHINRDLAHALFNVNSHKMS
jgi:hypothetical protein